MVEMVDPPKKEKGSPKNVSPKNVQPVKPEEEKPKQKEAKTLNQSNEHMALYKSQELLAHGEIFIKNSRFSRSRKYYAELRGCTIVAYKTPRYAEEYVDNDIDAVVAALPVNNYKVEATSSEDSKPRIYLTPKKCSENPLIYVRLSHNQGTLDAWSKALGRIANPHSPMPVLNNLNIECVIGRGGGGKVFLTTWNGKSYALKVMEKSHTFKYARTFRHVASERLLMEKAGDHPFLLPLEFAFQTDENLYIMTPFCPGGDLGSYLRQNGTCNIPQVNNPGSRKKGYRRLSESQTRRIASQVLLGLEHLHSRGIVYRDLKPENVFIDGEGFLQIGDYGLSKLLMENKDGDGRLRTKSVCGTRNYLPPEMLQGELYSFESDLWSFGVMIFRMLVGTFPFDAPKTKDVFQRIKSASLKIPRWLSVEVRQVLRGLLQKEPSQRVTLAQLKCMAYFKNVNWKMVLKRRCEPAVPDVNVGRKPLDALENFELSKLYGITIGELIGPKDEEPELAVAYHKKDPRTTLIGFEYIRKSSDKEVPLEVKVTSGNFLKKIASIDVVSPLVSPRKNK